ncbi:MAG: hypothetical protein WC319_13380 [Candidatus Paceibacterota bacterium]
MMYDFKKIELYSIDYRTINKIVSEVYGHYYEFVADIECGNDTEHLYFDIGNRMLRGYEQDSVEHFKETGKYNNLIYYLLEDMATNNIIPSGNYLILVRW